MRILFILLLLTLYMHVIACILWKLFSQDKVWIPPKEFGEMNINYMEDALINTELVKNYFVMVYYATFAFNLIDIAPQSMLEIAVVTIIFFFSAFYNAQIYAEFYVQRRN